MAELEDWQTRNDDAEDEEGEVDETVSPSKALPFEYC